MKHTALLLTILAVIILSGCKVETTGSTVSGVDSAASDGCDRTCQQLREDYVRSVNDLSAQAKSVISKAQDWKSVSEEDSQAIALLKDKVSAVQPPEGFEMVHDYYRRGFDHYAQAFILINEANEQYALAADPLRLSTHNEAMIIAVNKLKEANHFLVYADEEIKLAEGLSSKLLTS